MFKCSDLTSRFNFRCGISVSRHSGVVTAVLLACQPQSSGFYHSLQTDCQWVQLSLQKKKNRCQCFPGENKGSRDECQPPYFTKAVGWKCEGTATSHPYGMQKSWEHYNFNIRCWKKSNSCYKHIAQIANISEYATKKVVQFIT